MYLMQVVHGRQLKMSGNRVDMKIVLLGKEYGGKTSLVERYLHDRFTGDMPYQSVSAPSFCLFS